VFAELAALDAGADGQRFRIVLMADRMPPGRAACAQDCSCLTPAGDSAGNHYRKAENGQPKTKNPFRR
jgi:hypothetical protein